MKLKFFATALVFLFMTSQQGYAAEVYLPAAYLFPWDFAKQEAAPLPQISLKNVKGLLVPHHMVVRHKVFEAYRIFAANMEEKPETIIILSPNHYEAGESNIQMNSTGFRTKFGTLEVDSELENAFDFPVNNFPFYREHGISAQVNFIKYFFPDAKVVPIILKWKTPRRELDALVAQIANTKGKIAIIASVDFSHYQSQKVADFHDILSQNAIERCDARKTNKLEIDSRASLYVFLKALGKLNFCTPTIFSYTNSQSFTRNFLDSTTSHFIAFFGEPGDAKGATSKPKRIPGLYTVIHVFGPEIAGQEDRFFMGNDEIFLAREGKVYRIDQRKKRVAQEVKTPELLGRIQKGNQLCGGKDFGLVRGNEQTVCFH